MIENQDPQVEDRERKHEAHTDLTLTEAVESFTGYDEIGFEQAFGYDLAGLKERGTTLMRAAVFVLKRREGLPQLEAKDEAMKLPLGELQDYFADDDEVTPDEPDTPAGKDGSPLELEHGGALSSVSTPE